MDVTLPNGPVPHIGRIGRHVKVPAQQNIAALVTRLVEKFSQALKPVQLEFEFVAS